MSTKNALLILLSVLIIFTSCKKGPDINQQAKAMCICLHPLDSLNSALVTVVESGNDEVITDMLVTMSTSAKEARRCLVSQDLPGSPEAVMDPGLQKLLGEDCPGWEEILKSLPPE